MKSTRLPLSRLENRSVLAWFSCMQVWALRSFQDNCLSQCSTTTHCAAVLRVARALKKDLNTISPEHWCLQTCRWAYESPLGLHWRWPGWVEAGKAIDRKRQAERDREKECDLTQFKAWRTLKRTWPGPICNTSKYRCHFRMGMLTINRLITDQKLID